MTFNDFTIVILPGIDGARVLRDPLAKLLQAEYPAVALEFPPDRLTLMDELVEFVLGELGPEEKFFLVSESFSGPIALRVAARLPGRIVGVALIGSYVSNPFRPPLSWVRFLIGSYLFRLPTPEWFIRYFIVGSHEQDEKMPLFKRVAAWIRPEILASRLRGAFLMDARKELVQCPAPILHIMSRNDRILPRRAEEHIRALRPDVTVVEIDTGHCMIECRPDLVAPILRDFIREMKH